MPDDKKQPQTLSELNPYGKDAHKSPWAGPMRLIRDGGLLAGCYLIIWLNSSYGSADTVKANTETGETNKTAITQLQSDYRQIKTNSDNTAKDVAELKIDLKSFMKETRADFKAYRTEAKRDQERIMDAIKEIGK